MRKRGVNLGYELGIASNPDAYKIEGLRRMQIRKNKRNSKYRALARKARDYGCPISGAKGGSWADSSSPTGYMQICDWKGTCQSPCNGDC